MKDFDIDKTIVIGNILSIGVGTHYSRILGIICLKDGGGYTFCENIADNLSQGWRWIHIL